MTSNAPGNLTDTVNSAAAPARSIVDDVIEELNSGHGNRFSAVQAYKRVDVALLVDSIFDPATMSIFGNVEISSSQQTPNGDNYRMQRNFRISRDDARQLAKQGPQLFRASFDVIAGQLDEKYAAHVADVEAQRERQRVQCVADTMKQMSRLDSVVAAPKAARFTRRS